jgi:hypothetical protein
MNQSRFLGPVPCQGCRMPVIWNGKKWRNPGQTSGGHACKPDGYVICGALMPQIKERCARFLGHHNEHRSRYAMDNATRSRRKWAA